MRFGVLGPIEVTDDGGRKLALGGLKQRSVLAILLLHPGEVVSRDRLMEDLWSSRPPPSAVTSLQAHVSRLRRALGDDQRIVSRGGGYVIVLSPGELDSERFEQLIEAGNAAIAAEGWESASAKFTEALALWRGPPLSDFQYDSFAQAEIGRLRELQAEAFEGRLEAELAMGRATRVIGDLERLVGEHPYRERLRMLLMLALYRSGRQAEALEAYRKARAALIDELGIEPSAELRDLHQAILAQDPSLFPAAPEPAPPQSSPAAAQSEGGSATREERKVISALVANAQLEAEPSDPEDLRALLEPYQARVRTELGRFGGTLEKLIGGEATAVFGAPAAHEDDPERAVRAAIAIRDWAVQQGDVRVRVAVDTGEALVGGDSAPGAVTAGEVVHRTGRLHVAAPPNAVLVGERTYLATREAIEYRAKDESGWEALGARPVPDASARTPLVGRTRELDLLASTFARVREELSPQLVTLVGVPGIGKSRLVHELERIATRDDEAATWRQGRSLPYGEGVTFWALGEMVKQQAEILESDGADEASEKLALAVGALMDTDADWIEAHLRPLVGLSADGPSSGAREAATAWRRFVEALAEQQPTVLVFEDLHWADDGLLDFIDDILDRASGVPLLVLATARPELLDRRPGWSGGKPNALVLSLPPLTDDEAERMVASLLKGRQMAPATLTELVEKVGGNPLYAEQYARALLERGMPDRPPENVQGIIAARLDALSSDEKRLLQDAAVVGSVFWLGAVEAIDRWSPSSAEELFYALSRKEFVRRVRRSSVAGETEYSFSHALLRDVAYGQIPRAARSEKHERAAAWIESLGRAEDHAEMLAHHYLSALEYGTADSELVERARVALRTAGERALALASYPAAARFFEAALDRWPDDDPDRVWLLARLGRARFGTDRTGGELLQAAVDQLESRGDLDGAAQVTVELAHVLWVTCNSDAAAAAGDRALALTRGRERSRARAYALVERAAQHMHASEHAEAISILPEALTLTSELGMDELRVRVLDLLGASRGYGGDPSGLEDARRAIALARELNAFSRLIVAELNLRCLHFFFGELSAARELRRTVQRDVEAGGSEDQRRWFSVAKAGEDMLDGRWDEAKTNMGNLIADIDAGGAAYYLDAGALVIRAMISLARGELEVASADTEKALQRARKVRDPQILAQVLLIRATVLLAQDRRDDAASLATELLGRGSVFVVALLELAPSATPIELAWLVRDLGMEDQLARALAPTPPNPWFESAAAIARGEFEKAIKLVVGLDAPSVEAYTRLRAAQEMAAGRSSEAVPLLQPALAFYRSVGASRYIAQAERLMAAKTV